MPTEVRYSSETARLVAARNEALRRAAAHAGAARLNAFGWRASARPSSAVWPSRPAAPSAGSRLDA